MIWGLIIGRNLLPDLLQTCIGPLLVYLLHFVISISNPTRRPLLQKSIACVLCHLGVDAVGFLAGSVIVQDVQEVQGSTTWV